MQKFLWISDLHLCSKRPGSRLDNNFFTNQLTKFDEIVNSAITHQVSFLVFVGDFFDTPSLPDFGLLNLIIPKLRKLRRAKIPCYMVLGSHDMFGYNLESVDKTAVGSLLKAGLVELLHGLHEIEGFQFYGVPATLNHTIDLYKHLPKGAIVVTHNMLTPTKVIFEHILLDDLSFCQNFFLCGHYHKPFYEKRGKSVFLNIGPIIRTEKTENDHTPKVAMVERVHGKLHISYIELTHEQNVFDLTEKPDLTNTFTKTLQTTKFTFYDLADLTKQLGKHTNVPQVIVDEALQRITDAQRNLYARG